MKTKTYHLDDCGYIVECDGCGKGFTDDQWENRHQPHATGCCGQDCDCNYNTHEKCCWECNMKKEKARKSKCPSVKNGMFHPEWKLVETDVVQGDCVWHKLSSAFSEFSDGYVHHRMNDDNLQVIFYPKNKTLVIKKDYQSTGDTHFTINFKCEDFKDAAKIAHKLK